MRCLLPEQVFIDGVAQYQKPDNTIPGAGQFSLDSSRHVILGTSPSGHTVEVTTRWYWVRVHASDVTINGFRMQHSAPSYCCGGIEVGYDEFSAIYDRVTISNNTLSDTSTRVIAVHGGSNHRVTGNTIYRAGQLGIAYSSISSSPAQNSLIQNNILHDNNTEDFGYGYESGGVKVASYVSYLTLDRNTVYNNRGTGLWADGHVYNTTFTNNIIHNNLAWGISVEISRYGTIAHNRIWENGWGCMGTNCAANSLSLAQTDWVMGAGILSSTSGGFDIHDNIEAWNADGIVPFTALRSDVIEPPDGTLVHNNYIFLARQPGDKYDAAMLGFLSDRTTLMTQCVQSGSCRSYDNLLYNSQAEPTYCRFTDPINSCRSTLALFQADGVDTGSRYISAAEASAVLSSNGMPTAPESH
jgi:parallel beta-helix repeat protein